MEYSFDDGVWLTTPETARTAGPQEQSLLGIPYGSTVTFRVVATDGADTVTSADQEATAGPVPMGMPPYTIHVSDPTRYDPAAPYLYLSVAKSTGTPPDRASMQPRLSWDGRSLLLDRNSYWPIFDASLSTINEIKIDGTQVREYATPGLHHDWTQMPDESIAYGATLSGDEALQILHVDGTTDTL